MNIGKSVELFEQAKAVLPGGVDSPVRAFRAVGGQPLFIERGEGPYLYDVDGNRYIDYVLSWGPLILGHAHPEVVACIRDISGSFPEIEHVNEVLTMHMGPEYILVNLSVDFADTAAAEQIEDIIAAIDRKIKEQIPEVKRVFVEAESHKTGKPTA